MMPRDETQKPSSQPLEIKLSPHIRTIFTYFGKKLVEKKAQHIKTADDYTNRFVKIYTWLAAHLRPDYMKFYGQVYIDLITGAYRDAQTKKWGADLHPRFELLHGRMCEWEQEIDKKNEPPKSLVQHIDIAIEIGMIKIKWTDDVYYHINHLAKIAQENIDSIISDPMEPLWVIYIYLYRRRFFKELPLDDLNEHWDSLIEMIKKLRDVNSDKEMVDFYKTLDSYKKQIREASSGSEKEKLSLQSDVIEKQVIESIQRYKMLLIQAGLKEISFSEAIEAGYLPAIDRYIRARADLEQKYHIPRGEIRQYDVSLLKPSQPLLMGAVRVQHPGIVSRLLSAKASTAAEDYQGDTPLILAAKLRNPVIVDQLIEAKANVNQENKQTGRTPFILAVQSTDPVIVDKLIAAKANVNQENKQTGLTPFILAVQWNDPVIVDQLIEAKANVNQENKQTGEIPLIIAAKSSNDLIVDQLIAAKANVNQEDKQTGETPLIIAAKLGNYLIVDKLIEKKADVNQGNKQIEETPLMYATRHSHIDIMNMLIEAKADVNKTTKNRVFAVMLAVCGARTQALSVLLEAKADVNARDPEGRTALMIAGKEHVIPLLEAKAEIDAVDKNGNTALFEALNYSVATIGNHDMTVASLLIKAKANIQHKNREGLSCIDVFKKRNPENPPLERTLEILKEIELIEIMQKRSSSIAVYTGTLFPDSAVARAARRPLFEPRLLRLLLETSGNITVKSKVR